MKTTEIFEGVRNIINDFLLENGGYENGYETYVVGKVHRERKGGISDLNTPELAKSSMRILHDLQLELETRILNFIHANQILQEINIQSRHIEHGCFIIEVSIVQKLSFTCKK